MILLKKFLTVSGMTLVSRILGVIREMILSIYLGASLEMDTCLIAMKFPKFFRKCFSEEGLNSVLVPSLAELEVKKKSKFARLFSSEIFSIVCYISLIITILVVVFAKYFVLLMAPGFANDPEKLTLTIYFTRIMFPGILFLALTAIYSGILISNQQFGLYTVSPLLVNITLITSILLARNSLHPGRGFAYGVLSATIVQFLYLLVIIKAKHLTMPKLVVPKITSSIKQFFKKLAPVIASAGVAQINVFIDSFFSSYLFTGCITYLYFADRLNQLPLSLFGISMSIILLPEISKIVAKNNSKQNIDTKLQQDNVSNNNENIDNQLQMHNNTASINKTANSNVTINIDTKNSNYSVNEEVVNICRDSILFTLRLTFPVVVIISSLSYNFIDIIYGYGKFTKFDVANTATVLSIMSLGLPAYVLAKILSAIFFAQKNTKAPIRAALVAICSNVIFNALLMKKFQFAGIAMATMISGYLQMLVLGKYLDKNNIFNKQFILQICKILLATVAIYITILIAKHFITIQNSNEMINNILILTIYSIIGLITYLLTLCILKDKAVCNILRKYRK